MDWVEPVSGLYFALFPTIGQGQQGLVSHLNEHIKFHHFPKIIVLQLLGPTPHGGCGGLLTYLKLFFKEIEHAKSDVQIWNT